MDPTSLLAEVQLTAASIQTSNLTTLLIRSQSRISEIIDQQLEVHRIPAVKEMIQKYNQPEIRELLDSQVLPTFLDYNHIIWTGGRDSYLSCNLAVRAPDYVGQCTPKISCSRDNDTAPYTCPGHSQQQCGSLSKLLPIAD